MNAITIGCHVSAAGGLFNAPKNAAALGCEVFQMFSRSPQGGAVAKITDEMEQQFKSSMKEYGFSSFVIHAPYIINFGSIKPSTFHGSISIVRGELERGSQLGARYVMFHPGSFKDLGEKEGMAQVKKGLTQVLEGYEGDTQLLIEISAGAGSVVGDTFEELAQLCEPLFKYIGFGGICYDTQHAFASGYDIRTPELAEEVFDNFKKTIGLEYFRMSHVNDSKVEFAAHKDRHEHLGDGYMGVAAFENFLAQLVKRKLHVPLILETEHDKVETDLTILKDLRNKSLK